MARTIMVSDRTYAELKKLKGNDKSFSDVILESLEAAKPKKTIGGVLKFAGILEGDTEYDEVMEMVKEDVGKMGQEIEERDVGIILDTSVCIEIIKKRGFSELSALVDAAAFLSSITLFELTLRTHNLEAVETFVSTFEILDFDGKAARKASEISKALKAKGTPIEPHDIFIAATAIANNCALATLNEKDFSRIKGLRLVKLHE